VEFFIESNEPRRLVAGRAREAGVDHGVFHTRVADPVLDKAKIGAGIERVRSD